MRRDFGQIEDTFLSAIQQFCLFYVAMWGLERANTKLYSWAPADRRIAVRRSARVRHDEQNAKKTRVAVIVALFLAFLAAALLIGGRAFVDPMLRAAAREREANRVGAVVFTMPDGAFCRHLSFDNNTAEVNESAIDRCPEARPRGGRESENDNKGFAWRAK
jgi:hypothetical protein